jgi:hypothetical protein
VFFLHGQGSWNDNIGEILVIKNIFSKDFFEGRFFSRLWIELHACLQKRHGYPCDFVKHEMFFLGLIFFRKIFLCLVCVPRIPLTDNFRPMRAIIAAWTPVSGPPFSNTFYISIPEPITG